MATQGKKYFWHLFGWWRGHYVVVENDLFWVHNISMCYDMHWQVVGLLISAKRLPTQAMEPTQGNAGNIGGGDPHSELEPCSECNECVLS